MSVPSVVPVLADPAAPLVAPAGQWYAVRTRSNHEVVASSSLAEKRVAIYLPIVEASSARRDRKVTLRRPLFPGYFFVRSTLDRAERIEILRTPGVVDLLGSVAGPAPIPDWQIRSIHRVLSERNPFDILFGLHPGRLVRVITGPLTGLEGVVVLGPDGHHRLVISVEILGRAIAVRLASHDVLPV